MPFANIFHPGASIQVFVSKELPATIPIRACCIETREEFIADSYDVHAFCINQYHMVVSPEYYEEIKKLPEAKNPIL